MTATCLFLSGCGGGGGDNTAAVPAAAAAQVAAAGGDIDGFAAAPGQNGGTDAGAGEGAGGTAAPVTLPDIFYETWNYGAITYYAEDRTIVGNASGTANFYRDGTYELTYYIGSILNGFKGRYTVQGDTLQLFNEDGTPLFTFTYTVGENPGILVLTIKNPDGSPSLIYALEPAER